MEGYGGQNVSPQKENRERKGEKAISEEIMAESFPELMKGMTAQTLGA